MRIACQRLALLLLFTLGGWFPPPVLGENAVSYLPLSVDFPQIFVRVKILSAAPVQVGKDQFKLWEDETPIVDFSVASSTSRQWLVLLLDRSSSLEQVIGDIRRSAEDFVSAIPDGVKMALISFASDIDINQDFTASKDDLRKAIRAIRSWGGTVLYDSALLACEQLYYISDPRDLRTLVLFTDGRDETPTGRRRMSTHVLDDVLKMAVKRNIRILTVGLGSEIDEKVLKQMARTTNGWYLHAPNAKELFGVYQKIADRMNMERHYSLSYITPHPTKDGKRHFLTVESTINGRTEIATVSFDAAWDPKSVKQPAIAEPLNIAQPILIAPPASPVPPVSKPVFEIRDSSLRNLNEKPDETASTTASATSQLK